MSNFVENVVEQYIENSITGGAGVGGGLLLFLEINKKYF